MPPIRMQMQKNIYISIKKMCEMNTENKIV